MADKVTLNPITTGYRSLQQENANNQTIETAFDNTLSRDGTSPNQMEAPLDMNSNPIINLPQAVNPTDPTRLEDVQALIAAIVPPSGGGGGGGGGSIPVFANVQALRSGGSTVAVGTVVYLEGARNIGVGAGFFLCRGLVAGNREDGGIWIVSGSNWFQRIFSGAVNSHWWGMGGPGTNSAITATDLTNNPNWLGTYTAGVTTWSTVGMNECILTVTATNSTVGSIVWNANSGVLNRSVFVPNGAYNITQQLGPYYIAGWDFQCEEKSETVFNYYGPTNNGCFFFDSLSFATVRNLTIQDQVGCVNGLLILDWDGTIPGLKTQMTSWYDLQLLGGYAGVPGAGIGWTQIGVNISPSGGAAQGDTQNFFNPLFESFYYAGMAVQGANALNINVWGGQFIGCTKNGIYNSTGSVYCYSTTFVGANQGYYIYPQQAQIPRGGADYMQPFAVGNEQMALRDCRSENNVLVNNYGGGSGFEVSNAVQAQSSFGAWGASGHYHLGYIISGGTRQRQYMLVDDNGPPWLVGQSGGTTTTANFTGVSWTTNQWAGYIVWIRFGSGTCSTANVVSNTASSITVSGGWAGTVNTTGYWMKIAGVGGGSTPSFDTSVGSSVQLYQPGTSVGFTGTAGSTSVTFGSGVTAVVGQYIVIPDATTMQPVSPQNGPTLTGPYIAKVLNLVGSTATMSVAPSLNFTNVGGYSGAGVTDGQLTWLDLDWDNLAGVTMGSNVEINFGRTRGCQTLFNYSNSRQDTWRTTKGNGSQVNNYITGQNLKPVSLYNLTATISGTQDLSVPTNEGDSGYFSYIANTTVNFPTENGGIFRDYYLYAFNGGGGVAVTLTWGTNTQGLTTSSLGSVNGKWFVFHFQWNPASASWFLVSNAGPY